MDYSTTFAISAAGMSVERMRVDAAALNLANANTVQGSDGKVYRPLRVVSQPSEAVGAFAQTVNQGLAHALQLPPMPSASLEEMPSQPRLVYEPGHPAADAHGFVAYAGVDTATEMITMMSATRAYEANVAAMNTARTLAMRALDIGGNN